MRRIITEDIVNQMAKLYIEENISTEKIGEMFGFNGSSIREKFRKLGIMRSNKINSRRYSIDENYFENIDTTDKAYWLGFIYADGYISIRKDNGQKCFGISLSSKDRQILDKLNKCLKSDYEIKDYITNNGYSDNTQYSRLLITSSKLVDDLIKHGVVENKSNILKPPNLEHDLIKHFIRGYIDGDGCITKSPSRNKTMNNGYQYSIIIVGTDDILNYINSYLYENDLVYKKDKKLSKRHDEDVISQISYNGNSITLNILNYIYKDSDLYLDRKYNIYKELVNYKSPSCQ